MPAADFRKSSLGRSFRFTDDLCTLDHNGDKLYVRSDMRNYIKHKAAVAIAPKPFTAAYNPNIEYDKAPVSKQNWSKRQEMWYKNEQTLIFAAKNNADRK